MRVLVVGGGGREHAFVWSLARDPAVTAIVSAPGNPGIADLARCVPADPADARQLLSIADSERIDLTVVGPELPLSRGVADAFTAAGKLIVGPSRQAAALEWSKVFAKRFMARHAIPTARFLVCDSAAEALSAIARGEMGWPLVLKADGLAAGKGVIIASNRHEAEAAVRGVMIERRFGSAGERLVLEEFLAGHEASYFVLSDGLAFLPFSSAQDHKRIFDDDRGPNTGGMGAFAPSPLLTLAIERQIHEEIVRPVLAGMTSEGHPYRGFLYVGLMMTAAGPKVVEFNVRFGDPEAQVVLPMLDDPIAGVLHAAAAGRLSEAEARFGQRPHVGVVLAAAGYPDAPRTGQVVHGLDAGGRVPDALVFHSGTRVEGDAVVTAGGRVLTIVGRGASYREAIAVAYRAAGHITFDGMQMRRDIGLKAVHPPVV
jgi:phosphoribosylamine--glycine ligase